MGRKELLTLFSHYYAFGNPAFPKGAGGRRCVAEFHKPAGFQFTVLIAEDEPLIRMAYAEYLTECGYVPIEVGSGDAAVEVLEKNIAIDIVLSDVRMPGKHDGFAVARWVAENRPHVPVILVSGDARARENDPQLGGAVLLRKPVEMRIIDQRIRDALSKPLQRAV
jgi:CheY-like chemotaxis protein